MKSRYRYSKIINRKYFIRPDYTMFDVSLNNIQYHIIITKLGDRLDILASKYFGEAKLWWIIASINKLSGDSFFVPTGTTLYIPKNFYKFI